MGEGGRGGKGGDGGEGGGGEEGTGGGRYRHLWGLEPAGLGPRERRGCLLQLRDCPFHTKKTVDECLEEERRNVEPTCPLSAYSCYSPLCHLQLFNAHLLHNIQSSIQNWSIKLKFNSYQHFVCTVKVPGDRGAVCSADEG